MASLSAELSAERGVSEETRKQVLEARTETSQYQAQVRGQRGAGHGGDSPLIYDDVISWPTGCQVADDSVGVTGYAGETGHQHGDHAHVRIRE